MNTTDKVHFTGARYLPYFDFWKSHLANYGQGFSFIQKKRHEAYHEGEYKSASFELDAKLVELAKGNDTGIFVCFLSAFSILFNRYTEERHIVIHSPLNLLNSGGAIYSSEVPLFFEADQRLNLKEYLNKVRTGVKECYNYQNFPVELLNDQVESGLFLSNILVNYNGLHASAVSRQYDLTIGIENKTDKILIDLKYNTNRFEDYFIASFQEHLKQVFSYFDDLNISLEEIDILPEQEKKLLLSNFNFNTTKSYPSNKTIHRLFEETAVEHPESIAIVFENKQLTYKELNEQSNQLAHYIKEQCGVTKGDLVGLLLDHSEDLIVSILAILKAGAAYVPLDPSYPHHRIKTIIEDATVKVLITNQSKESYSEVSQILFPDIKEELYNYPAADHSKTVEPTDLAYIMYTSGTTGVPKGVMIEHKSVINLIEGLKAEFEPQKEWKYILTSSIAFDASVKQMLLPLTNGSELHIIRDLKVMDGLRNYIGAHNINVMHASPSVWNEMLKGDSEEKICFDSLKCISSGGDKLSQALANTMFQVFKGNQLRNMYGPTETCINALCYEINATLPEAPPIGKPLPNYQVYILDSLGRLQPSGIPGEIYISGDGLARGYLNHPELTDRKFTVNPFKSGDTIYNTGDLGRWLPDGNIEFIGRKDHQVKIRGNRIELGEIENALLKDADIESTIVVAKEAEDGEKQLIAYYSGKKSLKFADLRNNLEKYLPDYMIPSYFIYLESFPLSPNGKVDLKLLPSELTVNASRHDNPRNELESSLIKIWKRVLRKENIGISDNFFELGGHSLKATQIVSAIYKELNSKVQLKSIFSHPTIADLALAIEATRKTEFVKIPVVPVREHYDLSNAQRRLWVLNQLGEEKTAYNIPGAYLITGELNLEAFERCFETLITRHESLRTSFILVDGEPKQKIHDDPGYKLKYIDLRDEDERETIASRLAEEEANATFDLEKAPLLRAQLIRLEERKYLFLFTMHHIISDGWSMQVLAKEVFSLYNIYIKGSEISLPQLNLQYKDYSVWQKQQLDSEGSAEILAYWQQQLDHPSVLKLPTDYPRPAIKTYRGDTIHHMISADLTSGLKSFCLQHNVSLFMTLLACVKVILYHYTKQEDLIIGSPVAGRNHPDLEDQIGFYVNTLVLRTKLAAQKESFEEILDKVKATTLKAYEYQHYPFDHLLENLNLTRDMSRSPLFDVMVVIQNSDTIESVDMEGIKVANYLNYDSGSKFDLSFYFHEKEENIVLDLEYNKDLFKQERIQLLACEFESMVASVLADKKLPVAELNFRSSYEEGFYEDIKKNTVFEFDF